MKTCIRFICGPAVLASSLLLVGGCQPLLGQTIYTPYHFTTIAGSAGARGSGDGVGAAARFSTPYVVAVDSRGNVYVADIINATIRKITPSVAGGVTTWTVTTFAGAAGVIGSADGTGAAARFCQPQGLYVDDTDTIYVYDNQNALSSKGTALREITPAGVVTTIAFDPLNGSPLNAYNNAGNSNNSTGGAAPSDDQLLGLASGGYVLGPSNNLISIQISGTLGNDVGTIIENYGSTLPTTLMSPGGHADGPIASATENITGNYLAATQTGRLAVDGSGNVYVADGGNDLIRKITRTVTGGVESWYVTTLGGVPLSPGSADGTGAAAQFKTPCSVAVDASGNVYVADTANNTIRIGTPYQAPVANNATVGAVLGQAITFTLPATDAGGFSLTYAITGTTGGTATLAGNQATFTPSAAGTGTVTFTANDSYATSSTGTVTITTIVPQPVITLQANSQTVASGRSVAFNAMATGSPAPTYQWTLNGSMTIPGATGTADGILLISGATSANAGAYVCTATNSLGSVTTTATLNVMTTAAPGYLTNISSRAVVGTGGNILIAGFGISGTGAMDLLVRAGGPTLAAPPYNGTGYITAPQLTVFDTVIPTNPQPIVANVAWGGPFTLGTSTVNVSPQIATTALFDTLGAYEFNVGSADSAIEVTPPAGTYTAQVSGVSGVTGIVLAEIYDADPYTPSTRLVNISTRASIGTGANILIGGFAIGGTTAETVLIRAVGPTLTTPPYNGTGYVANPQLTLYAGSTPIYSNTGWADDATLSAAVATVGAFPLNPTSADSALLVTLPPASNYTAQVSGVNNGTGIALMEIYEVY